MRIINTIKKINPKSQARNPKQYLNPNFPNSKLIKFETLKFRISNLFRISIFEFRIFTVICLLFFGILSGCSQEVDLNRPQEYVRLSQDYYQRAISGYNDLIRKGKDIDTLYFELGQLYYDHGDFIQAQVAFKSSAKPEAKKFLAITNYKLGNFTDALEIFNKEQIADDEYLYFYGLTCERLNLFDKALEGYNEIKGDRFKIKAKERIDIIEKEKGPIQLSNINHGLYKILQSAPAQEEYPQAGALILYCDEKIEVTGQGTEVSYLHYIIKILNERGKEDFAEAQIDYDSTYEKVELEYARTIKPNGELVEVGSRHIRDVTKYLNFPLYSNVRIFIISFPEVSEGSAIEYKLKVYRSELINKKDFVLSYPLQAGEPIIEANFCISFPKENTLHLKTLNDKFNNFKAGLDPVIEQRDGFLIYRWHFRDIPQILPESNMPPGVEINPTILFSSFDSWQEVYSWWWSLAKDKIKPNEEIRTKIKELIRDKKTAEEKLRAIYNFCVQKIRYVAVEYGQAGYEPHSADTVFKNKYGDCKDQAVLLVTMLKEAGFTSYPVLIATKKYYNLNEDFPAPIFNHCIAAVVFKGETIFLDPTAETCPLADLPADDQARGVLLFKDEGYEILKTPLYPAGHNFIKQRLKIRVEKDEAISAEKSIFTSGIFEQAQRYLFLYTPPELIQDMLNERIQEFSIGARLERYQIQDISNLDRPVVLTYAFRGPEYFTAAGNLRIMPNLCELDVSLVAKEKRKYNLDFNILDSKELIFELEIPGNFVVKYIPVSFREDSPWLEFSAEYRHETNKIYFKQKTELKKTAVLEEEYRGFKNFFEGLAKQAKQRIVLEKRE